MQIKFETDSEMSLEFLKIITHPAKQQRWPEIQNAIMACDQEIIVMDAQTENKIPVKLADIIAIESEDRMCNVKMASGQMYLLNRRLKKFEETNQNRNLIRINHGVIINLKQILHFQSSENARIEVTMKDKSIYAVNRYYIKTFKENLS